MRQTFITLLLVSLIIAVYAGDRPTAYYLANGPARGVQKQANGFAIWNRTTSSWQAALPLSVSGAGGTVNGIVAVGGGVLAYGSFNSINGNQAASLAYYDGNTWCAPDGVGLYTFTPQNPRQTLYENPPTAVGSAFAAVVDGNDVYLLGLFNQVGLTREGVAGLVKLTWANGAFTVDTVGSGYFQTVGNVPCAFCARDNQPPAGNRNTFHRYTVAGTNYFALQPSSPGDVWTYAENGAQWVRVTSSSNARNITGNVRDFDTFADKIYVVGNFEHFEDPTPANQYFHIAVSSDAGSSWQAINATLPVENFGNLPAQLDQQGNVQFPALQGSGFHSITVVSASSIYVAGGYRITERNKTANFLANELQTRIVSITPGATPGTGSFNISSERWSAATYSTGFPNFQGPDILYLDNLNGSVYAAGNFIYYNQIVTQTGAYFGNRYTQVFKNVAVLNNGAWSPAFGGWLTGNNNDNSPTLTYRNVAWDASAIYFQGNFQNSYELISGGIFAYDGDRDRNLNQRWHSVLSNQRYTAAVTDSLATLNAQNRPGIGANGVLYSAHITQNKDALIFGGQFDWIGGTRISAIAAYTPDDGAVASVGGGLFQYNNGLAVHGDNTFNNRISGQVYDIEERSGYLYAAGVFNRNNSGNCLANIARYEFRVSGRGWEPVDGGCNGRVRDILFVGSLLYITGDFTYCGLNPAAYRESGGLLRGRVPTLRVAVVDTGKDYERQSWRPLGVGLNGGGSALARRGGDVYVGGTFTMAGGKLYTGGIARWNGDSWEAVVSRCRSNCNRPNNIFPFYPANEVVDPNQRKPAGCTALGTIGGDVYCIASTSKLAWWSGSTWTQAGNFDVAASGFQNTVIIKNATDNDLIIVRGASTAGPNDNNYLTWDSDDQQFVPSHAGFSQPPNTFASASSLSISLFLLIAVIVISLFF